MSGYEVCQHIRKQYLTSELPVIMVTARNQVADLVQGLDLGANDYLAKPFTKDEFLARIRTHLNLHRIHRATGRFVPHEFLRSVGRDTITEVALGDHTEQEVTIMFTDIRDYTTLAETMLFEAGLLNRRGSVENKNTVSDYHEIEQERGSSVFATPLHTEWRNYKINIIDTPGLDDFIGEILSSIRVADTIVTVVNARNGVEIGTEIIWNYIGNYNKPTVFVVNQIDHPAASFDDSFNHYDASAVVHLHSPLPDSSDVSPRLFS